MDKVLASDIFDMLVETPERVDILCGPRYGAIRYCCDSGRIMVRFLDKIGQIVLIFRNFRHI